MAPDRSGPQAPVTKLSRWWPFGVVISWWHNGGIFFIFNPSLTELVLKWQTAQAKTANLKKY